MKLLTIDCREVAGRPGVLLDSGEILDLATAPSTLAEAQWIPQSVVSIIAAGDEGAERIQRLIDAAERLDADERERMRLNGTLLPYSGTALMAPIRRPGLVLITGSAAAVNSEPAPSAFIKSPNTVVGHGAAVSAPWSADGTVSCTGMLAVVLGRPLYQANEAEAEAAIAAYTLLMDLSLPVPGSIDSAAAWRRFIDSKQFPGGCPIGPAMITTDEIDSPDQLQTLIKVNGCIVSERSLCPAKAAIAKEMSALSSRYGFRAGDVVAIEPSEGGKDHMCRLHDGDRVSIALDGVMELEVTLQN